MNGGFLPFSSFSLHPSSFSKSPSPRPSPLSTGERGTEQRHGILTQRSFTRRHSLEQTAERRPRRGAAAGGQGICGKDRRGRRRPRGGGPTGGQRFEEVLFHLGEVVGQD